MTNSDSHHYNEGADGQIVRYQERHKDMVAAKIVTVKDQTDGSILSIEVYGTHLDGTTAWILIHTDPSEPTPTIHTEVTV